MDSTEQVFECSGQATFSDSGVEVGPLEITNQSQSADHISSEPKPREPEASEEVPGSCSTPMIKSSEKETDLKRVMSRLISPEGPLNSERSKPIPIKEESMSVKTERIVECAIMRRLIYFLSVKFDYWNDQRRNLRIRFRAKFKIAARN